MPVPIRLEVENFDTQPSTFDIQDLPGIASNNQALMVAYQSQGGPAQGVPITTSTTFGGPDGVYDALLGTFDETGGDSRIVVHIDGVEVADFLLDQSPGGGSPDLTTAVQRDVATAFEINTGDLLEITVYRDGGEFVRLDFLDLIPISDPPVAFKLSELDGTNGVRLDGIGILDDAGFSVSSAGDVNGDGIDDVIVGAPEADADGTDRAGESYVVFGSAAGFGSSLDLSSLDGTNGFRLDGIDIADYSGASVSAAGDINGDGVDDVIIGARRADPGGNGEAGESYVVFGNAGGFAASLDLASLDGTNGFRLDGIDPDDFSGGSVSSAGDVNGDGIDDVIIGAASANPDSNSFGSEVAGAGESYVVFGTAAGFSATFDLASLDGTNGFRVEGVDEFENSGTSVSAAGDVNGDGIGDLIIGAPEADVTVDDNAGQSYVVFGRDSGFGSVLELESLDGTTGFRVDGSTSPGFSGRSVSAAGDVNADGFDDVVIGAYFAAPDGPGSGLAGQSFVVFGSDAGFAPDIDLGSLDGTNGFRLDGIDPGDRSGYSVSQAGDFNGDGVDDLIIGAERADPGLNNSAGESYVLFGSAEGFASSIDLSALNGTNGFRIDGVEPFDSSGISVSGAGDFNDDGYDDLIIGADSAAPDGATTGAAYVLFGGPEGPGSAVAGYNLTPVAEDGHFAIDENAAIGTLVGAIQASDGDGDPLTFTIVGGNDDDLFAIDASGQITLAGLADHENGAGRTLTIEINDDKGYVPQTVVATVAIRDQADGLFASDGLDPPNLDGSNGFTIVSDERFASLGRSVSSAGDVNADGIDDLIVGASRSDPDGNSQAGSSHIVFGTTAGFGPAFNVGQLDGTNGFRLDGVDSGDNAGHSVSRAGDINGDGIDDLIVGAYNADPNGNNAAGESYVVFGSAGGFPARLNFSVLDGSNGFRINGITADDESGFSVSAAGDINNDGIDDLIVGARLADPGGDSAAGETYVVFGDAGGFAGTLDLSSLGGANGFRLDGIDPDDISGESVSNAGDVNDDGIDDLIIGASGAGIAGEAYVVFGSGAGFGASFDLSTLNGANGFLIDGGAAGERLGRSVSAAGDVNDDGIDDVIIGSPDGTGQNYVVFGSNAGFGATVDVGTLNGNNGFRLDGIAAGDFSGYAVGGAGDINGDGIDDIVVSSYQASPPGTFLAGEAYVVFGSGAPFGPAVDLSSLNGTNGFRLDGVGSIDALGRAVSGAGDINGDGVDDVIIGAYDASPNGDFTTGAAYVVYGRDDEDQLIRGTEGRDLLVGGLGDDTLLGDIGGDRFVISQGNDLIIDFQLSEDKIGLEGLDFGPAPPDINDFVSIALAGPNAQLRFDEDGLGDFSLLGSEGTLTLAGVDLSGSDVSDLIETGVIELIG